MKKIISIVLAVALIFVLAVTAMAAEIAECTVSVDSVPAAGKTVTVPVRITGNRGFTNFGIALDYDREQLELLSIQTAAGDLWLCDGCPGRCRDGGRNSVYGHVPGQ